MFNPQNQNSLTTKVNSSLVSVSIPKYSGYSAYSTAKAFGIGASAGGIAGPDRVYVNTAKTQTRKGLRIDLSDTQALVVVGDILKITVDDADPFTKSENYQIVSLVKPEIQKKSGQYVSTQTLNTANQIPVLSSIPNRTYQFDISINITDIST